MSAIKKQRNWRRKLSTIIKNVSKDEKVPAS